MPLLGDGLKHVRYISKMMSDIEGASRSASLTSDGIKKSIFMKRNQEKFSRMF